MKMKDDLVIRTPKTELIWGKKSLFASSFHSLELIYFQYIWGL